MTVPPIFHFRILVISAESSERDLLCSQLREISARGEVFRSAEILCAASADAALLLAAEKSFDLCLVGDSFTDTAAPAADAGMQEQLLQRLAAADRRPNILLAVGSSDADTVRLLESGATAVVLRPLQEPGLSQRIQNALEQERKQPPAAGSADSFPGIPWLLENFSYRLEHLAQALEQHQDRDSTLAADSKLVKEALLGIIGAGSQPDDDTLRKIATYLRKKAEDS
jgi:CheY-like chemotaxis protein